MMQTIIDTIVKYLTQELIAGLCGIIILLWRRITKIHKEMDAIRGGVRGNLRIQIKQEAKQHLENGFITIEDREILDELFSEYFELNGNGPVKLLKSEIDKLPTRIDAE